MLVTQLLGVIRDTNELHGLNLKTIVLEVFLHVDCLVEVGVDDDGVFLLVHAEFLYTEIDEFKFEFVKVNTVFHRDGEASLAVEEELEATLSAECAAELGEIRADVRYGTHVVVRGGLYEDSDTMRSVAFVVDLLIALRRFIGRFLDSAVDVILRHILSFALLDQCTQTWVRVRIRSSLAGCYGDFFS